MNPSLSANNSTIGVTPRSAMALGSSRGERGITPEGSASRGGSLSNPRWSEVASFG